VKRTFAAIALAGAVVLGGCSTSTSLIQNPLTRFHNTLKVRTKQEQKDYDAFLNAPSTCIKKCITMPARRVKKMVRQMLLPAKPQKAGP